MGPGTQPPAQGVADLLSPYTACPSKDTVGFWLEDGSGLTEQAWNGLETLENILGQGDGSVGEIEAGGPELRSPAPM